MENCGNLAHCYITKNTEDNSALNFARTRPLQYNNRNHQELR